MQCEGIDQQHGPPAAPIGLPGTEQAEGASIPRPVEQIAVVYSLGQNRQATG